MTAATATSGATTAPPAKDEPAPYVPNYVTTTLPAPPGLGIPGHTLYIISDSRDIDAIDEFEGPVYFVLACSERKTEERSGNTVKTVTSIEPGLYKRMRVMSGNGLVPVLNIDALGMGKVKEAILFDLPPMPQEFIDKIEHFFRVVDEKNHTEAIVILGFEEDKLGTEDASSGWTVLVPDQKNTSSKCNYDPPSVMAMKPDNVRIVGSIHSHPGMSAYASHTDAGDQFNNDGLHITIGWKGKNGAPEYYIEYQLGNKRYIFQPEEVFDFAPKASYDVDEWLGRVEKETWQGNPHNRASQATGQTKNGSSTGGGSASSQISSRLHGEFFRERHNKTRPKGCPDILDNIVIAVIPNDAEKCPNCGKKFDNFTARNRRCTDCFTYLMLDEDDGDLRKIYEARKTAYQGKAYMPGLEFIESSNIKGKFPVLLWDPRVEKGITCLYNPKHGLTSVGGKALGMTDATTTTS